MNSESILSQIEEEIARLQQVRALLAGAGANTVTTGKKRGPKPGKKRKLSPEARQRIVEAVKRRWAKQKGAKK